MILLAALRAHSTRPTGSVIWIHATTNRSLLSWDMVMVHDKEGMPVVVVPRDLNPLLRVSLSRKVKLSSLAYLYHVM
jgi:hypothetical protein